MMYARNHIIQQELQEGNPVQFRVWGNSLYPRAHKGDCVIFEPVIDPSTLKVKDIVFCHLIEEDRFSAYVISNVRHQPTVRMFAVDDGLGSLLEFDMEDQSHIPVGKTCGLQVYGRLVEVLSPS